jgi:hypothetical protein
VPCGFVDSGSISALVKEICRYRKVGDHCVIDDVGSYDSYTSLDFNRVDVFHKIFFFLFDVYSSLHLMRALQVEGKVKQIEWNKMLFYRALWHLFLFFIRL